jgi:hypothetical protein
MTGCFHVMEAIVHRSFKGALQQTLGLSCDRFDLQITPALLKAHAPQRQHRHGNFSAPEASGWQRRHAHQT